MYLFLLKMQTLQSNICKLFSRTCLPSLYFLLFWHPSYPGNHLEALISPACKLVIVLGIWETIWKLFSLCQSSFIAFCILVVRKPIVVLRSGLLRLEEHNIFMTYFLMLGFDYDTLRMLTVTRCIFLGVTRCGS